MKKIFNLLLILTLLTVSIVKVQAMNFQEAFNQSSRTPMVVLIYAQWADNYQKYIQEYRVVKNQLGNKFNFVEMDIASPDTKFFNTKYHIYPNVPYILMFREGGRVSRYIPKDCASSSSCISSKLKSFLL